MLGGDRRIILIEPAPERSVNGGPLQQVVVLAHQSTTIA
jgi:hypothetical protein